MFVSTKVVLFIASANNDVIKNRNKVCLRRLYRCNNAYKSGCF